MDIDIIDNLTSTDPYAALSANQGRILHEMIAGSQVYSKTNIIVSSDERLKENIEHVDQDKCLEFVNNLDVNTFNYIGDKTPCMGVIAQDLQNSEFADYFVFTQPGEDKYLAVKAADLVFLLIAAVQKLSAEVDNLKKVVKQTPI